MKISDEDMIGKKFNRLTVIEKSDIKNKNGNRLWKCICDCGNIVYAPSWALIAGHTRSCGCLQKDITAQRSAYDLVGQKFFIS